MNRLILQFSAYLHLREYAPSSISNYRLDIQRFADWLAEQGSADLDQVRGLTQDDLMAYREHLGVHLGPRSLSRHLTTLKLFYKFLENNGLVGKNPMIRVSYPRVYRQLPPMLTPTEVETLLATPNPATFLGLRDKTMLELLYASGLKLHELIALDDEDLKLDLGVVQVRGRRHRMVPLTPRAVELLARYVTPEQLGRWPNRESLCLFPSRGGARISRVGIWKLIKKYALQAGIQKNFNPRTLRHAFAIHLILGGMDLDGIKMLFGYKHLEATQLYAHVNSPDFRATWARLHPSAQGDTAHGDSGAAESSPALLSMPRLA